MSLTVKGDGDDGNTGHRIGQGLDLGEVGFGLGVNSLEGMKPHALRKSVALTPLGMGRRLRGERAQRPEDLSIPVVGVCIACKERETRYLWDTDRSSVEGGSCMLEIIKERCHSHAWECQGHACFLRSFEDGSLWQMNRFQGIQ